MEGMFYGHLKQNSLLNESKLLSKFSEPESDFFFSSNGNNMTLMHTKETLGCFSQCVVNSKCKGLISPHQDNNACQLFIGNFPDLLPELNLWIRSKLQ